MNFKTTYLLFGILFVVLLVFVWTLWLGPSTTEQTAFVLPSMHKEGSPLEPKDITRVEIERTRPNAEKLVFVRESGSDHWRVSEPRDYQANSVAIDALVRQVYQARLDDKSDVLNNPQHYGLETPAEVITLVKEAEPRREVKLNVGDVSAGSEQAVLYVTSSDRKEVMAVKKSELDSVKKTLADFRTRELLSPSSGDIQAFTLSERDKEKVLHGPLELKKGSEDRWVYVQPPYGDAQDKGNNVADDKPPSNVEAVLSDLSSIKVDSDKDFVQDDAADLGKYNLDPAKNDILRIEIERYEESAKKGEGESDKEKKTRKIALLVGVGAKVDKKDQYYAYIDNPQHKDIVKISSASVARLLKLLGKPDSLRDRNLVDLGGFHKPDAIDVASDNWGLLEFRRGSSSPPRSPHGMAPLRETWQLWRGDKSYAVDETAMQTLIGLLTAPNQVEDFEEPAMKGKYGLDKPDAVVRIWADSLPAEDDKKDDKKDEKKDKKPQPKDKNKPAFTLSIGRPLANRLGVERKRGDEKISTIVLVPPKLRDQVLDSPLVYLDKQLPPFNADPVDPVSNVTKLTLMRDGTTYEISRENKPDAPWKIDKPADFAGRTADRAAVEDMLRTLNNLRADTIEDDKIPAADKLAQWGLKDPALQAVVTLTQDGKPKTFTFDFGKEANANKGVYLRTTQRDMIVVVGNNAVNTLKRELQDPTVFHFEPSKVQEVKLTGWSSLFGKPHTLTFKHPKSGSGWEVEPKDEIKLDPSRLDALLKNLSDLKATKFIAHKAKPTDAQALDAAKGGLHVELTVAGDKEPRKLTLMVGKADGDGFLAVSNQLPGDIFTVRKDIFEKVKEKLAYFSGQ